MANDPTDTTKYPLGTTDLYVAARNASDFDKGVGGDENTSFTNRFGATLPSYRKAVKDALDFLGALVVIGDYSAGQNYDQFNLVRDTSDGTWYVVIANGSYLSVDISTDLENNNIMVHQVNIDQVDQFLGLKYGSL